MDKRKVILYNISDLLVRSKIEQTASSRFEILNLATVEEVCRVPGVSSGVIVICDLTNCADALDDLVKASRQIYAKVVGFYPHVQTETRRAALSKGVDIVVPRSAFEATLRKILDKN